MIKLSYFFLTMLIMPVSCFSDKEKALNEADAINRVKEPEPKAVPPQDKPFAQKPDERKSFIDYCVLDERTPELEKTVTILLNIVDEKLCGIAQAQIGRLEAINIIGSGISDLRPLRFFTLVSNIDLRFNQLSDIKPIFTMLSLEHVALDSNPIKTLEGISALKRLQRLSLKQTQIQDLSAMSGLESLRELYLNRSSIKDLKGAENLKNLEILDLETTAVSDLSPLAKLNQLKSLNLASTMVSDLSELRSLDKLENLDLTNTPLALDRSLISEENCPSGEGVAAVLSNFCDPQIEP